MADAKERVTQVTSQLQEAPLAGDVSDFIAEIDHGMSWDVFHGFL